MWINSFCLSLVNDQIWTLNFVTFRVFSKANLISFISWSFCKSIKYSSISLLKYVKNLHLIGSLFPTFFCLSVPFSFLLFLDNFLKILWSSNNSFSNGNDAILYWALRMLYSGILVSLTLCVIWWSCSMILPNTRFLSVL